VGDVIQPGSPDQDPQEQVGVDTLNATLMDRVDEVIRSPQKPILSTTGHQDAIEELARHIAGLEIAVREIALEVQEPVTSQTSSEATTT
jgi:hypothetical protein